MVRRRKNKLRFRFAQYVGSGHLRTLKGRPNREVPDPGAGMQGCKGIKAPATGRACRGHRPWWIRSPNKSTDGGCDKGETSKCTNRQKRIRKTTIPSPALNHLHGGLGEPQAGLTATTVRGSPRGAWRQDGARESGTMPPSF